MKSNVICVKSVIHIGPNRGATIVVGIQFYTDLIKSPNIYVIIDVFLQFDDIMRSRI